MHTHTRTWQKKKKEKSGKPFQREGEGARTENGWVMSTEMLLLGSLAQIKTHKSKCTHTKTRYITLLEVYEGSEKQG